MVIRSIIDSISKSITENIGDDVINWPCVLKLNGDDELQYIENSKALKIQCQSLISHEDDYLIDIQGHCYSLSNLFLKKQLLVPIKKTINLNELTELIKMSECSKATLCVTKIRFKSIAQAIQYLVFEVS